MSEKQPRVVIVVSPELHKAFKKKVIDQEKSMNDVGVKLIEKFVAGEVSIE